MLKPLKIGKIIFTPKNEKENGENSTSLHFFQPEYGFNPQNSTHIRRHTRSYLK